MKKLLPLLLLWLVAPLAMQAQETLTIYEGTETNNHVPAYLYFFDDFTRSQVVFPASELEEMSGGTINGITFYTTSNNVPYTAVSSADVYLMEVNYTSISAFEPKASGTTVFTGYLSVVSSSNGGELTITFNEPYAYQGGNLLIGIENTQDNGYKNISFYGQTVSGASVSGSDGSSLGGVSPSQQNFIPKTTFLYTPDPTYTCRKPKNLSVSNVTSTSATLSWTQSGDVDHWDIFYTDNPNYEPTANTRPQFANITDNPFTLTNLPTGRTFNIYVRANCGDEVGDWVGPRTILLAEQITLNDGTATNQLVPLAGYYVSYYNTSGDFILPASDLQDLLHAEIRQVTFYTESPADISWGELVYSLRLKEIDVTELNTNSGFGTGQQYFYSKVSVSGNKMTLTFSEPYVYEGGNLLFSIYTYKPGTVVNVRPYWLGVTTENTSGYGSSRYSYRYSTSYSSQTSGVQSFLPKTTIYYAFPECVKPTGLEVSDITTSTAILSWTAIGNGQTGWELQYRKADETDYTAVEGVVTNPYTLQGLESSHGYVARVRAVCGNDSYSDWLETQFYTDCTPITLPYITGFEDVEEGMIPPCWSRYSTIENSSSVHEDPNQYGWTHMGTHCLYFYGMGDEYTTMAVLPQIPVDAEHPMNGNEMVFYAAGYYTPTSCQVGIMTDPNDPETFELVQEMEIPNYWYGGIGFRKYRVSFADYTGNGTYIAIRKVKVESEQDYVALYVDDLEVRPIPGCQEPTDLTVTAVTSSTATLQWTAGGEETAWQVQYTLRNEGWPDTYQTTNQNPFTLEGLTQARKYQARVRAVCSATETSDWTDYTSFDTYGAVPYLEDFGDFTTDYYSWLTGWEEARGNLDEVLAGTTELELGYSAWQTGVNSTFANNGMTYYPGSMADVYPNSSPQYEWFITPNIELGEGCQLSFDLSLDYNQSATSGLDDNRFAVVVSEDGGATWAVLALWDYQGTLGRTYYDIPALLSEVNLALPSTYDNKTVRFAFYVESTVYNSGSNHLYLDNVNVTKCIRPELIVASDITTNSAVLDWTTHGETSWTLQYRIDGQGDWTTVSNITAHPYTLEGLVGPNTYQVRVKAHNAAGDSEWSNIAIFDTECVPISLGPDETYEQYFEGESMPACWSGQTVSGAGRWSLFSYYYDEQGNRIYAMEAFCNGNSSSIELTMPQITVTPGLCLTFHHDTGVSSNCRIFAFVTLSSLENVILWDSDTDDLSAGVTTVSLNDYVGQTITFTFTYSSVGTSSFLLMDVTLFHTNTFSKQTENGYWNETANWSKGTVPVATESVAIAGEAVIPANYIAHANEIFVTNGGSLTIADGGQLEHNNTGVVATTQKSITPYTIEQTIGEEKANGWYLIASPMQQAVEPSGSLISNNFDLYRFNQSANLEWENYLQYFYLSPYFKLFNGKGYLYANNGGGSNEPVTIEIEGQLQPGNEELEIPLNYDVTASLAGWNLTGNPFAHNMTSYTGTNVAEGCYRMNDTRDDLMVREVTAADPLKPMEGFFVKATGTGASLTYNASRRDAKGGEEGSICVDVLENGKTLDRLIVKAGNREPLEKLSLSDRRTKLFAERDHREVAIVSREGNEQAVSFKAKKNGTYTIKVNVENMGVDYLHLIDNLTGADIDLLQTPTYTFTAKTTDYASRFRLVFDADVNGASTGSAAFAFNNGSEWVISNEGEATVQVFDVIGRQLLSREIHSAFLIPNSAFPTPGVYVLRLINGDDVKTQKVVVK